MGRKYNTDGVPEYDALRAIVCHAATWGIRMGRGRSDLADKIMPELERWIDRALMLLVVDVIDTDEVVGPLDELTGFVR